MKALLYLAQRMISSKLSGFDLILMISTAHLGRCLSFSAAVIATRFIASIKEPGLKGFESLIRMR
jgi:hypothetical protein